MKSKSSLALLAASVSIVHAHTIFQQAYVNGVSQGHLTGIRVVDYDGPIMDVTSNDLICNGGINPYHSPLPNTSITVPAGAQFTAEWHHTLDGADPTDSQDPIDPSHKGPVITYLARIPNSLQTDVTGLQWFKIAHDGLIVNDPSNPANQTWGVDRMIANKGKVTVTIPSCIAAGQYLLRHEVIALHAAVSYPGAQFYMECAQLTITGGGSTQPATVSFPGAYHGTDPGITTNIYYPILTNYTIPGPPVFSCSGAGSAPPVTTPVTTSVKTTSAPVTTVKSTTASAPATTSSAPAGTVPEWGQCGGASYIGPTVCQAPFVCTFSSQFYSQCL
ncbi:glycosyl hydrolase family 61-domain-containing protein [Mycena amicta]|nr:glycosyl hydrolase family 61-domain-containing protein [Mycena amicta]